MRHRVKHPDRRVGRTGERLGDLVIGWRRGVVAATLLLVAVSLVGAARLRLNADFVTYLSGDHPVVRAYHHVGEIFGGNETGVVLLKAPDAYRPEVLALIDSLTTAYDAMDGIAYATSLTNALVFSGSEWGVEVGRLIRRDAIPATPDALAAVRRRVAANPRLVGNLVSADGTVAAIQLRLAASDTGGQGATLSAVRQVIAATEAIVDAPGRPGEVTVQFGGMPFLMYQIAHQIVENMALLVPLMVGALVLVLYLGLRHWAGVAYPLAVVAVSSALVLGVMGALGLPIDLLSGLVPVVLIVLGSADGIHYMKRYFERRTDGESAAAAAAGTAREIRTPLVLTTLTTMIAFGSLAISDVAVIRQFGLLTALGLFAALLVTLTLLPALAAFGLGVPRRRATGGLGALMGGIGRLVTRAPATVLAVGFAATTAAALGTVLIVKSVDWTLCLQRGSPPHRAELLLRDKLGGSLPVQLLVQGDVLDPATLLAMRTLERRLNALPVVSQSQSVAGVLAEMNAVMNGRYAVPHTRAGIGNLWFLVEGEDAVTQLVARGERDEMLIRARVADWETRSIRDAVRGIDEWLGAHRRLVVVDRRTLGAAAVSAMRQERVRQLVTQLGWEFAGRGRTVPASLPRAAETFVDWQVDAAARSQVRQAVRRYLESNEAETSVTAAAAVAVAEAFADAARVPEIDAGRADAAVHTHVSDVTPEDRAALILSLARVTNDVVGERRVADAMVALGSVAALRQDTVLRRDVHGALWEAHSPLMLVSDSLAEQWGVEGGGVARGGPPLVRRAGLASVLERMEAELLPTQIQSLLLTLAVVVLLLAVIFRSAVAGLLMVVPLATAVGVNFGTMGYLSLGLDSFTAMVASIAVGLGVDYAIHFTHRYREEFAIIGRRTEALKRTLGTSGVAILVNATSVGLGFLMLLAATCQHIRRFGGLTSLAMVVGGAATLLLLPALYRLVTPRFIEQRAQ